jgi:hypothetical protein
MCIYFLPVTSRSLLWCSVTLLAFTLGGKSVSLLEVVLRHNQDRMKFIRPFDLKVHSAQEPFAQCSRASVLPTTASFYLLFRNIHDIILWISVCTHICIIYTLPFDFILYYQFVEPLDEVPVLCGVHTHLLLMLILLLPLLLV